MPLSPDCFRVAARVVYDPEKGKVRNFLGRIFRSAQQPALLSGDMPLREAIEQARDYGKYYTDERNKKWEIFVYQMDSFADLPIITKEVKELSNEVWARQMSVRLDTARMEAGIHMLAATFWPKP
ncbi:hypothetical protein M1437_00780 [Patescibacteria group bacterium]|nr:hypothetical protein [Patescibacteria group bacterium]